MNIGLAQTSEPPGHEPLVVNGVVVGPFEEDEEGTGIASDVVKVEGKDPPPPGCLRETDSRGMSAILNRGYLPPWPAREETPGP